jgi:DNA-binding NarL/FixJ family response regulator
VKTSDGYSIAYAVSGAGRPLVFLPGVFEHIQLAWQYPGIQPWLEGLAARFRLIQIDERGAGMSSRGLAPDTLVRAYCRDLDAVVEKLEIESVVLFGTTVRARVAALYAIDHPERVAAIVFGPFIASAEGYQSPFWSDLPADHWDFFLRNLVSNYVDPSDRLGAVDMMKEAFDQADFVVRMRAARQGIDEDTLSSLRLPTLVLHPRDYPFVTTAQATRIAQLTKATMTVIDGSFALGDAAQGISAIETFLATIQSGRTETDPLTQTGLSTREAEVLRLLAAGRSNQQIADELVISLNTVKRHVSNVFDKTGVANRAQAAAYAKDHGIA